ncbi:hypothetical protein HK107_09425 [Parvularcula sp. ZS-1/3]|uniref:Uncharacterized protein n=1 Tax=Parvularcula mediterranea TaxID=2732508 RepID=A0A7Y3W5E4_9PROT|nr:hypothetical protein [Parvularcula mediterranea]NNU16539.1 hypothetical protein [Parvularcula mediterranea]
MFEFSLERTSIRNVFVVVLVLIASSAVGFFAGAMQPEAARRFSSMFRPEKAFEGSWICVESCSDTTMSIVLRRDSLWLVSSRGVLRELVFVQRDRSIQMVGLPHRGSIASDTGTLEFGNYGTWVRTENFTPEYRQASFCSSLDAFSGVSIAILPTPGAMNAALEMKAFLQSSIPDGTFVVDETWRGSTYVEGGLVAFAKQKSADRASQIAGLFSEGRIEYMLEPIWENPMNRDFFIVIRKWDGPGTCS